MTCFGVLAGAHHHDAADDFAAVDVERAAAEIAADLHRGDVLADKSACRRVAHERRCCSRSSRLLTRPMPRTTNSMPFSSMTLPPTLRLLLADRSITSLQGHAGRAHFRGGNLDLILPHEAADARDLGHALTRR